MERVYIVVTRSDTVFDDSYREVSAIFKTHNEARNYLQKKYEEYSEEAKKYNEEYECDEWACWFDDEVVHYQSDMDVITMKVVSVGFGEEIDVWKLI